MCNPGVLQTYSKPVGNSSVHRAKFLDALVKHVPKEISHFGKRLKSLTDLPEGSKHKLKLEFEDGSTHETDVVLGCDGIHSKVRGYLDQETAGTAAQEGAAVLQWSGSWAYRGAYQKGRRGRGREACH
jgi:salicylate hydroxylase